MQKAASTVPLAVTAPSFTQASRIGERGRGESIQTTDLWPLAVHFVLVVALVAAMVGLSYVLGHRRRGGERERATGEPYESGIRVTGSARGRLSADFYLVALLFVIFDLEVAFLFGWAIAARDLGWAGYGGLLVFVAILVVGLIYEWRRGALDWGWSRGAFERARSARRASREALARGRAGRHGGETPRREGA